MDAHSSSLFLSVVTVAEIEDRVLVFDAPIARIAGAISDRARGQGHAPGFADIVIGATAQRHRLTVLSRNTKHFEPLGVAVLDPFAALPRK
jgi:predicted nucleic acid-binding protein